MSDARSASSGREAVAAVAASVLVGGGVYLGPGTGVGAGVLAAGVLAVGAVLLVPVLHAARARRRWERAVRELSERGLVARDPEQLGAVIAEVHAATGAGEALLVVPGHGGAIEVISSGNITRLEGGGAIDRAFAVLAESRVAAVRGDPRVEPLLSALGAAIAVPLVHRSLLVGLVGFTDRRLAARPDYLESFQAIATVCLTNTFLDREARSRSRSRELFGLAGEMQRSLGPPSGAVDIELPGPVIRSAQIAGRSEPMSECGGDVLAWRRTESGELVVLIGDAAGHGAAAALLAAQVLGAFEAAVAAGARLDPGAILDALDRRVAAGGREHRMTALVAQVSGTGAIRIASAGHCGPLVIGARGVRPIQLGDREALGAGAGPRRSLRVDVGAGHKLVAFTDGLIEAGAPVVAPLGERRLRAAVTAAAQLPPEPLCAALFDEVERFLGGQEPADDVTAVVVEVAGR